MINIYKQHGKYCILKNEEKYAVVWFTDTNCMACAYGRKDNISWLSSNKSQAGMDSVADWVTLPTAKKRFNELTKY